MKIWKDMIELAATLKIPDRKVLVSASGNCRGLRSLSRTANVAWVIVIGFGMPVEPEECNTTIGLLFAVSNVCSSYKKALPSPAKMVWKEGTAKHRASGLTLCNCFTTGATSSA